jgi:hypothetical protein
VRLLAPGGRLQVRDNLVAEEIEVNPLSGTAALRTSQNCAVKITRGVKIINRKGDMKRGQSHKCLLKV